MGHRYRVSQKVNADLRTKKKKKKQAADWMWSLVKEGLNDRFYQNPEVQKILPETIKEVENGTIASTIAANRLLDLLDNRASD